MTMVCPGLAAGMGCGEPAPKASPPTNTAPYPQPQVQVPEFWIAHDLTKVLPGATVVLSGIVTSLTKVEASVHVWGTSVFVAGTLVAGGRPVAVGMACVGGTTRVGVTAATF